MWAVRSVVVMSWEVGEDADGIAKVDEEAEGPAATAAAAVLKGDPGGHTYSRTLHPENSHATRDACGAAAAEAEGDTLLAPTASLGGVGAGADPRATARRSPLTRDRSSSSAIPTISLWLRT